MSGALFDDGTWKIVRETASLPDGRTKTATRVYRCPSVHIIAETDDGNILLLREFRPFYGEWIWMLPSGRVDKETDIDAAAARELREETGYAASTLTKLRTFDDSEALIVRHHVYHAAGLRPDPLPQDEDELIEVHACTPDEAIRNVLGSARIHTLSAAALLCWKERL